MTDPTIRPRLRGLMFLHYFVLGTWVVPLGSYLLSSPADGGLNFSAGLNAWVYSALGLAGLIAPPFVGLLADRYFSAQKVIACLYAAGTLLLLIAAWWCDHRAPVIKKAYDALLAADAGGAGAVSRVNADPLMHAAVIDTFTPLFAVMIAYVVLMMICGMLCNVVSLRNLEDPAKSFGGVRVFGTVGWIVSGLVVGVALRVGLPEAAVSPRFFVLAAGVSVVTSLYALTLPKTPPLNKGTTLAQTLGLPALRMFKSRPFVVFLVTAVGLSMVQQFYMLYANKYLTDLGFSRPTAVQTLAQWSEIGFMLLLPLLLPRLGVRNVILIGLAGWVMRNLLFATGADWVVAGVALPLHGLAFTFFFVVGNVYIDSEAPRHLRASAQGIMALCVMGCGVLAGNQVAAAVKDAHTAGAATDWRAVWAVPAFVSAGLLVGFAALFRPARVATPAEIADPIAEETETMHPHQLGDPGRPEPAPTA